MTLGQEIGAWAAQMRDAQADVAYAGDRARALAIGGTAVGTGLNAPAAFGPLVAQHLTVQTGRSSTRPTTCSCSWRRTTRWSRCRRRCARWPGR